MRGILYLEDGTTYIGEGFGKKGTEVGELVFNTSMTGYQEILTDPSYAGQVITMTYPLIGNYGINEEVSESDKVWAKGFVAKSISNNPSNYKSEGTLDSMLKRKNVVGIYGVDTRSITKKIRKVGSMKCLISNEGLSRTQMAEKLKNTDIKEDWMLDVSVENPVKIDGKGKKVVVLDFGIKRNILHNLKEYDCDITILPNDTNVETINNLNPDGILLSNGPGNPREAKEAIKLIEQLVGKYPIFGICMGHQVLALALGGDTYKMKYGHRGGNHGVHDLERDKAYITSQNHSYAVDLDSILAIGMKVTHVNLNDGTVEGMKHSELPIFSVQFHPEGSPGPGDSVYLFKQFIEMMKEGK